MQHADPTGKEQKARRNKRKGKENGGTVWQEGGMRVRASLDRRKVKTTRRQTTRNNNSWDEIAHMNAETFLELKRTRSDKNKCLKKYAHQEP